MWQSAASYSRRPWSYLAVRVKDESTMGEMSDLNQSLNWKWKYSHSRRPTVADVFAHLFCFVSLHAYVYDVSTRDCFLAESVD